MDEDEQDVYVAQLHEVFDSCDHSGKGFLNRSELVELCKKLQLDDQVPQLLQQLLGSEEAEGQVCKIKIFTGVHRQASVPWQQILLASRGPCFRSLIT